MTKDNKSHVYDTIVIGAAISGAVAATILGRAGRTVLLIDPQPFPRPKACGEGLSILGQSYLEELGLWSPQIAQNAYPFYGYTIRFKNGEQICLSRDKNLGSPQGFGISREMLDSSVFQSAARLPKVQVSSKRVESVTKEQTGWCIQTSDNQTFRSRSLVLACGPAISKFMPQASKAKTTRPRFGMAFWCEGKWQNDSPSTIHIHHRPEGEYIMTPLSKDRINFSVLLSQPYAAEISKSEVLQRAREIAEHHGFFITSLTDSRGAAAIHGFRLAGNQHQAYVIGDAVERFDPIGGMGMAHGIYSGVLAANSILHSENSPAHGLEQYYRKREKGVRILRLLTSFSYGLNTSRNKWLQRYSQLYPNFALRSMEFLRGIFPGAHSTTASTDREMREYFSLQSELSAMELAREPNFQENPI